MEPTFEYPKADAREVFVPYDPKREEFWCPASGLGMWLPKTHDDAHESTTRKADGCGEHWRRRIPLPEGWEIVPEPELKTFKPECRATKCLVGDQWCDVWNGDRQTLDYWRKYSTAYTFNSIFIRRKPATKPGQWFSVKDRLPANRSYVLVFDEAKECEVAYSNGSQWISTVRSPLTSPPTHWMPLPEPPIPPKSEAELAWEKWSYDNGIGPRETSTVRAESLKTFLAGYAVAKGTK